eukprot:TRINITY_DN27068_c0_g1_i1.p1 TRINITY_DN27068_c0_g1~~TRINITY_DN27068_c0_g1_i1.p1  ORF type:complete len:430 (-),score=83.90 TRINITY_DN27068_c0_g1_i1:130-1419(-)
MEGTNPAPAEAVLAFLGSIPLLQRLPILSLKKIAEVVRFKSFDKGDYLAREGEHGDGLYFIWKGEVEVSSSTEADVSGQAELLLREGDYFGHGNCREAYQVDIIALSKVTCLVLRDEHLHLLSAESIWDATKDAGSCPEVEIILQLENLGGDIFRGTTVSNAPKFQNIFGGQLISQALAAATKSVNPLLLAHSLHSYFIQTGDVNLPIIYNVQRVRDGKSFSTRHVEAVQRGQLIFTLLASFHKPENSFDHQQSMPSAPDPDSLMPREKIMESYMTNPRLPISYRNMLAKYYAIPIPIEIRHCEPPDILNITKREPRQMHWFRARGKLSDDYALHRCVAAYASDLIFLETSMRPHRQKGQRISMLSLDHSMWFHKPFKADEWLLFVMESPIASNGRGFNLGKMYTKSGELVVSVAQEGLTRRRKLTAKL